MTTLKQILEFYRNHALSEREKGTTFEKLVGTWLLKDPVQSRKFAAVVPFAKWARCHEERRNDTGIDLVATRHNGEFTAVQCKLYASDHRIQKSDLDSFMNASGKSAYAERLIVETTEVSWSANAESMLVDQRTPVYRIGLQALKESTVDWSDFMGTGEIGKPEPKQLRCDQRKAVNAVTQGLAKADRGKLIMACGTGKTLTGLRIAEFLTAEGGLVLYLVPSLALMSQTVPEWCADTKRDMTAFAVCSDSQVGKRRRSRDDVAEIEVTDLAFPATTNAQSLARSVAGAKDSSIRVVFATYHSISVIAEAQAAYGMAEFDLIVCDEAHRTTGVKFAGKAESHFVKVHDNDMIRGRKRLYMTATPRIYGDAAKSQAREREATLASMDDPALYGQLLYHYGFASAVEKRILVDYRVIVLAMDEGQISRAVQRRLADEQSELVLDDATKIVGCWKALAKVGLEKDLVGNGNPMRRALAFCNSIKSSELIRDEFGQVVQEYREQSGDSDLPNLFCEVDHVDGSYKARERGQRLDWLAAEADNHVCRILSNARCLTEGVDVPALDAILFLQPRNSQIDVVQAVGRVMRQTPDRSKKMGYVILPVGVPPGVTADRALNDNERYRVIWQVLNALRAHDERLDAIINQGRLGQDVSDRITIVDGRFPVKTELQSMTAVVENLPTPPGQRKPDIDLGKGGKSGKGTELWQEKQEPIPMVIDELSRAIMAKVVEKCGTRVYWEDWAKDVAKIAERHITRIRTLTRQEGSDAQSFFQDFLKELRDDLNESITEQDAIEMLAQHLITRPVFEALFEDHEFVEKNAVSAAMQEVLSVIDENQVEREAKELEGFYASVRRRAQGITDPVARQQLIVELYDKFFREAFPLTTQKLGIVYTPVAVVDFIIRSVNDVLEDEFGQTLGSKGVHILDPFVGTGTFVTRLLQSGLIAPEDLERKYREEIHANDIVLLAYYIAAINIETVFHAQVKRKEYLPFEGICLTDTFALHEGDDLLSFYMKDNTDRRERQKNTDIRVIVGNPPYSAGQKSENDNAKNVAYERLDNRVRSTYAHQSKANLLQNLYDSYIRAIRWGSDRLGEAGVMAYVTGSAWIERSFADGLRKCLAEEFASLHVFHLRGDIRKNMLSGGRAGEGDNVFGQGSMTGVAITVFVKNPDAKEQGRILFQDIGDYLDRKEKLDIVKQFGSIRGIEEAGAWTRITPDEHGDWLDQRDPGFDRFLKIGDKKDKIGQVLFKNYSLGVVTARDAWCINPSRIALSENVESTIDFYNHELTRWQATKPVEKHAGRESPKVDDFVNKDTTRISWTRALKNDLSKGKSLSLDDGIFVPCLYRPFAKQWQFYSRRLNEMVYQMPQIFPNGELKNRVIAVTGKGGRSGFSALMMDTLPNLDTIEKGQCFSLWLYEKEEQVNEGVFKESAPNYRRYDAITDWGLRQFREAYSVRPIPFVRGGVTREDIFHYIYGLLHSEDYRRRYAANLSKELPRIPLVKSTEAFEAIAPEKLYRVIKMKHPGTRKNKDWSTVIYNPYITIREIPSKAWEYVVNGKPVLSWVMERQVVKTDKSSGIVSDANRYAIETTGDPRYPLDLFLKMITVSMETVNIIRELPELEGEI